MSEEIEQKWLDHSDVGDIYMRHEKAMMLCEKLPLHKSFAIESGFNVGMLRMMAENYKPKKIVVIDHGENGFEVRRLLNNASIESFYKVVMPNNKEILTNSQADRANNVKRIIEDYLSVEDGALVKYDARGPEIRKNGCVSFSYLQRRIVSLADFRKHPKGATFAIKETFDLLEERFLITKLTEEETLKLNCGNGAIFRINKELLDDKQA